MTRLKKQKNLPEHICSAQERQIVRKTVAKDRLNTVGVYLSSGLQWLVASVGIAFTVMLDIQMSGTLGAYYFEPIAGESGSVFGSSTVLACTLLTVVALHLASMGKRTSPVLQLIDIWAPRCALLFLFGVALLLLTTMTGDLSTGSDEWTTDIPFIAECIAWLNTAIFEPVGKLAFAMGFACVIFLSAFALSKFLEWWFAAIQKIIAKATHAKIKAQAIATMKRCTGEYHPKAADINFALSRSEDEEQIAFALLVYQSLTRMLSESRKHTRSDNEFTSYLNPQDSLSSADLTRLEKECSFDYILNAVTLNTDSPSSDNT